MQNRQNQKDVEMLQNAIVLDEFQRARQMGPRAFQESRVINTTATPNILSEVQ